MTDWIFFAEGQYAISEAYLTSAADNAIDLLHPAIEVYTGRFGKKQMKGWGLVLNTALVELHEDGDAIDLLLDLGADFRFLMENPTLQAGKVFTPGVRSLVHFYPQQPWKPLTVEAFDARRQRLALITS